MCAVNIDRRNNWWRKLICMSKWFIFRHGFFISIIIPYSYLVHLISKRKIYCTLAKFAISIARDSRRAGSAASISPPRDSTKTSKRSTGTMMNDCRLDGIAAGPDWSLKYSSENAFDGQSGRTESRAGRWNSRSFEFGSFIPWSYPPFYARVEAQLVRQVRWTAQGEKRKGL